MPSAIAVDQVDDLVGEAVLVAEPVAGRPPGCDVGVGRLGDEDPAEPGGLVGFGGVVELQDVHVLEVEGEAAGRAVDLDPDRVLAAGGEPGRLEDAEPAPGEPGDEDRGVVDGDRAALGAGRSRTGRACSAGDRPLLDEGLELAARPR